MCVYIMCVNVWVCLCVMVYVSVYVWYMDVCMCVSLVLGLNVHVLYYCHIMLVLHDDVCQKDGYTEGVFF